jgi:hypothetical protein
MEEEDTQKLVSILLDKAGSDLAADRLAMELAERGIGSPRLIAQAVEKYIAGGSPAEAADVEASAVVDTKALTKAVIRGAWPDAAKFLEDMQSGDVQAARLGTLSYLRKMLLHSPEISERTAAIARAVDELVAIQQGAESVQYAAFIAAMFRATAFFSKYKG